MCIGISMIINWTQMIKFGRCFVALRFLSVFNFKDINFQSRINHTEALYDQSKREVRVINDKDSFIP